MFNFLSWWKHTFVLQWGSRAAGDVRRLHSFPQAHRYFEETARPRGKKWEESQRPLYNNRSHHYRIEEIEKNCCYDLIVYDTPLIRYHKDGRVFLRGDWRQTSNAFMHAHGWAYWYQHPTLDGGSVMVPQNQRVGDDYKARNGVVVPERWSAVLLVGEGSRIDVSKSAHRPVYVRRSSPDDKAARAEFKAKHATLIDTLVLRAMQREPQYDRWVGRAFQSNIEKVPYHRRVMAEKALLDELKAEGADAITEIADAVHDHLAACRINWSRQNEKPPLVTPGEYRRALETTLVKLVGLHLQEDRQELPQFMEHLPRNYQF